MTAELLLYGTIWEVRPNVFTTKDKKTGKEYEKHMLEVTVEQIIKDGEYRIKNVEKVQFDTAELSGEQQSELLNSLNKFIFIPHQYRQWSKDGKQFSMVMPSGRFTILDKDPFNIRPKAEVKKAS